MSEGRRALRGPSSQIVSAVRIRIRPGDARRPLFAGQPAAATLSIGSSFHWRGPGAPPDGESHPMRFDVQEKGTDWLVSGRKKGDFLAVVRVAVRRTAAADAGAAQDGGTHGVPLTLVPLRHGALALPQVDVRPLARAGGAAAGAVSVEAHQVHGAERVLVLPRGGRTTFVVGMGGE